MNSVDCIVIGAGVVGLACARALALAGREVVILEAAETIGTEVSSRNSEVIHAGIYYPKDSLKATLCVRGKHQLYEYCRTHGIAYKQLGKLIVATDHNETHVLQEIKNRAEANGVLDLEWVTAQDLKQMEPEISAIRALYSPSTGIIDSHGLMLALLGDAERAGAMLAVKSRVIGGRIEHELPILLKVQIEEHEEILHARTVINSAGLSAPSLAHSILGFPKEKIPQGYYCKGNYFTLNCPARFNHLIYPVPNSAGLGVHLTLDLAGCARFGPDTEWVDELNYDVDINRANSFYEAIRRYWPHLPNHSLAPGYVGIRPKITGPNEKAGDFTIQTESEHGVSGWVNLFGIESPGITASLAIADEVASLCA